MIITRNQGLYKQGFYSAKKEVQVKSVNETSRRQRRPIQLDLLLMKSILMWHAF